LCTAMGGTLVLPWSSGHTIIEALDVPGGVSWEEREGIDGTSPEFKPEALTRASEDGETDKHVCEELGI